MSFTKREILENQEAISLYDVDTDYNLELYCYNSCTNNDRDIVKQSRGVVYNGDELVLKGFPYTEEYNVEDREKLQNIFSDLDGWKFFRSFEGCLLRLFFFKDKWFLSTHHRLNAYKSKWSCKDSFGFLFKKAILNEYNVNLELNNTLQQGEDVLINFYNRLDKECQYMFLLRNTSENRIVCMPPTEKEPLIYHVGTFKNHVLNLNTNINIPYPRELTFANLEEMLQYVADVDTSYYQGLICFKDNRQVKIVSNNYLEKFSLRGNQPSLNFRYLQIRTNPELKKKFLNLYPESKSNFSGYENHIQEICKFIYKSYVDRFIKKLNVVVEQPYYRIMSKCHKWHIEDRQNNRVTFNKVLEVINNESPVTVNHLIKIYTE